MKRTRSLPWLTADRAAVIGFGLACTFGIGSILWVIFDPHQQCLTEALIRHLPLPMALDGTLFLIAFVGCMLCVRLFDFESTWVGACLITDTVTLAIFALLCALYGAFGTACFLVGGLVALGSTTVIADLHGDELNARYEQERGNKNNASQGEKM